MQLNWKMIVFVLFLGFSVNGVQANETITNEEYAEIYEWSKKLPAAPKTFKNYFLCRRSPKSTLKQYRSDFNRCWSSRDEGVSCGNRCGGPAHIRGFRSRPDPYTGDLSFVIYCNCSDLLHNYKRYPVPAKAKIENDD